MLYKVLDVGCFFLTRDHTMDKLWENVSPCIQLRLAAIYFQFRLCETDWIGTE